MDYYDHTTPTYTLGEMSTADAANLIYRLLSAVFFGVYSMFVIVTERPKVNAYYDVDGYSMVIDAPYVVR